MLINIEGRCMLTGVLWYIGARWWDGLCGAGSIWQRWGNTGRDIPWLHSLWCSEESVWCQGRLLSFTYTEEGDNKQKEFHVKNYRYYFYCWTGHCRLGNIIGCCVRVMLSALEWTVWQLGTADWAASLVAVPEWCCLLQSGQSGSWALQSGQHHWLPHQSDDVCSRMMNGPEIKNSLLPKPSVHKCRVYRTPSQMSIHLSCPVYSLSWLYFCQTFSCSESWCGIVNIATRLGSWFNSW